MIWYDGKKKIMAEIRIWAKRRFDLYDIEDLITGEHCGCCGSWVPNEIVVKDWPWCVCPICSGGKCLTKQTEIKPATLIIN